MEAFLSNLPPHLTDRTLEKQLRPYMNALGISEWSCYSSRGKNLGWVTFLYPEDGNRFIARHGKTSLPNLPPSWQPIDNRPTATRGASTKKGTRDRANLHLMNVLVFVAKSHKPPDPFHIKSLHHRLQEKSKQRNQHDAPAADDAIIFTVMSLRCGHNSFRNPSQALTFVQECRMELSGLAKFGKKLLVLKYGTSVKIEIPYASIVQMIHKSTPCTFTLVLNEPPRFYHLPNGLDELYRMMGQLGISSQGTSSSQQFFRGTSIVSYPDHTKFAGKCMVYQFYVNDPDFDHKMITLERRSLFEIAHFNIAHDERPNNLWELDYTTSWDLFYGHLLNAGKTNALPFRILYLVQSLVWNNYLHPHVADDLLLKIQVLFKEARAASQPEPISDQAIKNLRDGSRDCLPFPVHGTEPHLLDPQEILDYLLEVEARIRTEGDYRGTLFGPQVANHHAWIFRAMVTPTRVTLHGPELEPLNRILRKYPDHTDYFMRVQFCDEDGADLFVTPKASLDQIFHRYREVLKNGISVAGRIYQFLGFSHSSLRSHAAWFLAPFYFHGQLQLYQNIIKSLGDFEHIQIPAKCAARIGQAFSETPSFISLEETGIQWRNIPDVKKLDGDIQRVFSDGVGTISQEALELTWPRLLQGGSIPTCLQIRWGGVKGMLSLDTRLRGRVMCIRTESMEKFPSRDKHNLEICDAASRPLRLVLNRQMIKIMEDLGVENNFFLRLQKIELDRLRAVTADAYNTGTFLHMQGIGLNCFLPTFIKALDKYGIDYRQDDFLRIVVESVVLRELRLLKHKARIPVSKGVTLFGIMDETGFLGEGEVYVCYDSYRRHGNVAIENTLRDGLVVVTRSPALHP
ncbi:RNA-dependent RNA polymerase, partial [Colletotrichum sojae]